MASKTSVLGVPRMLRKLEQSIIDENYYEAHQVYKTIYFRYLGQQKYTEVLDMLYNGAILFLENGQQNSGADVGLMLVDVLVKSDNRCYADWVNKLGRIFSKIDKDTPERDTFVLNSIRWSSISKENIKGHPALHRSIAQTYWNEQNYSQSRHHFLHSNDGQGCAQLLIDFHTREGNKNEADLFLAQTVLQYLSLGNKEAAIEVFNTYTTLHPRIKRSRLPYHYPLINFLWFLLQSLDRSKISTFGILRDRYELSIKRDPSYDQYMDKIGQLFFGALPAAQESNGILEQIFQTVLTGLDENIEDEACASEPKPSSSKTPAETVETGDLD